MPSEIHRDVVCTACGCMCNDIELRVEDGKVEPITDCWIAKSYFGSLAPPSKIASCSVGGDAADFEKGIANAAKILRAARYPLIYGMREGTTESQRIAIEIAETLGGVIDSPNSEMRGPSGTTFRAVGEVTCTIGEVRHRSDLVIYWMCDPVFTHPRHLELESPYPVGEFVPNGRKDRTCIVIDEKGRQVSSEISEHADEILMLRSGSAFDALWIMRALTGDLDLDAAHVQETTYVALSQWRELVERIKGSRHTTVFYGASDRDAVCGFILIEALHALVKDLNQQSRVVSRSIGCKGNVSGSGQVLTWTTGYPHSVDFARKYPRYSPKEYSAAELLSREEIDAVLIMGSVDAMSPGAGLLDPIPNSVPSIAVDPFNAPAFEATISFRTSLPGFDHGGTVYRVDGVPLPLRPFRKSHLPSEAEVLAKLLAALKSN